jgi:WD40 repeat protein
MHRLPGCLVLMTYLALSVGSTVHSEPADKPNAPLRNVDKDLYGDPLPAGALARMGTARLRHGSAVRALAFSMDGKRLASGGHDNLVRLWDPATGQEVAKFEGHDNWIYALAFAPDGKTLASGSLDNTVRLWDPATGKEQSALKLDRFDQGAERIAFSPDGKLLASASSEGGKTYTVRLWDVATGKVRQELSHKSRVLSLAFAPDGKTLASSRQEFRTFVVQLWDVATGKVRTSIERKSGGPGLAFSPDGTILVWGGPNVTLWDIGEAKETGQLAAEQRGVATLLFTAAGKQLITAGGDGTVRVWEVASGKELRRLPGDGRVEALALSRDGAMLALARQSSAALELWDLEAAKERPVFAAPREAITTVALSPDGTILAAGSWDRGIRLWDATSGKERGKLDGHAKAVQAVAFSPDGKTLASGSSDQTVRLWQTRDSKEIHKLEGHRGPVATVAFSADGRMLASGSSDKIIRLWNTIAGKEIRQFSEHDARVTSVAFSPDGRTLLSGSEDKSARLWDVATGKALHELYHDRPVSCVAFSPDGKIAASATAGYFASNNTITFWDPATGKEIRRLRGHKGRISALAFSPDGKILVSGNQSPGGIVVGGYSRSHEKDGDLAFHVWEVATGKELVKVLGHQGWVNALAFSADGRRLASGSDDTTVLVWDLGPQRLGKMIEQALRNTKPQPAPIPEKTSPQPPSGKPAEAPPSSEPLQLSHPGWVRSVSFCPASKLLAAACADGSVYLWDKSTGKQLHRLREHLGGAWTVVFAPDGKTLASCGGPAAQDGDFAIRLWDVASGKRIAKLNGHDQVVSALVFSPDGTMLTSACRQTIRRWDVATGKEISKVTGNWNGTLQFAAGEQTLLSMGDKVTLWDVATGRPIRRMERKGTWVSPDGKLVAERGWFNDDFVFRCWEVATGQTVLNVGGKGEGISLLRFCPDCRRMASHGRDRGGRIVHLWDLGTGKEVCQLPEHKVAVFCMEFSPDGRFLAVGDAGGTVLIHELTAYPPKYDATAMANSEKLDKLWTDLAGEDAMQAFRSGWELTEASKQSVPFFQQCLRPVAIVLDAKRLAQLISDLEDGQFAVRQKATAELEKFGEFAAPALRKLLSDKPALEIRRRVEHLLETIEAQKLPAETLCVLRAIQVLERTASSETRMILEKLAQGAPGARVTDQEGELTPSSGLRCFDPDRLVVAFVH